MIICITMIFLFIKKYQVLSNGFNRKEYLNEGKRVLKYNGEMIISESIDIYDIIKNYLEELNMKIIIDNNKNTNRWFIIHAIKQ